MLITKKEYEKLTEEQRNSMEYSNPCVAPKSKSGKKQVRVGEVFDDDLGYWRPAHKSDF